MGEHTCTAASTSCCAHVCSGHTCAAPGLLGLLHPDPLLPPRHSILCASRGSGRKGQRCSILAETGGDGPTGTRPTLPRDTCHDTMMPVILQQASNAAFCSGTATPRPAGREGRAGAERDKEVLRRTAALQSFPHVPLGCVARPGVVPHVERPCQPLHPVVLAGLQLFSVLSERLEEMA